MLKCPDDNECAYMKKKSNRRRKSYRRSKIAYYTVSLVCLGLIITGIIIVGSEYRSLSSEAVNSGYSEITSAPDPTDLPVSKPVPTEPAESYNEADLSTDKLGWAYSPGGSEGVPAKNTPARIELCRKFGGMWQGDTSKKKVYLTMDVGYEYNNNTAKALDIAKEKDFQITFFVVGKLFTYPAYEALLRRMHEEGHIVASHSWHHDLYDDLYRGSGSKAVTDDLRMVEDAYKVMFGEDIPKYFRFPSGEYSEAVMNVVHRAGYRSVFWSFSYRDWLVDAQPDPQDALSNMIKNLHNGIVFLLHPVSNTNTQILPELIDAIRERGYEIASLDDFE